MKALPAARPWRKSANMPRHELASGQCYFSCCFVRGASSTDYKTKESPINRRVQTKVEAEILGLLKVAQCRPVPRVVQTGAIVAVVRPTPDSSAHRSVSSPHRSCSQI